MESCIINKIYEKHIQKNVYFIYYLDNKINMNLWGDE